MSVQMPCLFSGASQGGSSMITSMPISARKLSALRKKQPETPTSAIKMPPAEGPTIFDRLKTDDCSAIAFIRSSFGTGLLTSDCRASWFTVLTAPRKKASTAICQNATRGKKTRNQENDRRHHAERLRQNEQTPAIDAVGDRAAERAEHETRHGVEKTD